MTSKTNPSTTRFKRFPALAKLEQRKKLEQKSKTIQDCKTIKINITDSVPIQTNTLTQDSERVLTDQGYLFAPASLSRIGVQQYNSNELGLDGPNRIMSM